MRVLVTRVAAILIGLVFLQNEAKALDVQDKLELCQSCHGEHGHPEMKGVPILAGRPTQELAQQLELFRNGKRENPQMVMAKHLTDEEIQELAAYFSRQPNG
ncbi:c-type cytochrome [Microvirga puerhi]|uniref:C-type cytochrome n=1 Tax=Microvirga puerhi TaxID=2876078 RepID=A0ABS7VUW9_9HYPH|nr:c-type cytochrome [Microvirga puerhi]MBZ6078969.1 c-type cytochrome [Microvirga puerhi]